MLFNQKNLEADYLRTWGLLICCVLVAGACFMWIVRRSESRPVLQAARPPSADETASREWMTWNKAHSEFWRIESARQDRAGTPAERATVAAEIAAWNKAHPEPARPMFE